MNRIDGTALAAQRRSALATVIKESGTKPVLASVLVGDDPASALYVKKKTEAATEVGVDVRHHTLPVTAMTEDVLALLTTLNADTAVHGILVQLPLPKHLDTTAIIAAMNPAKDVDGFHSENLSALAAGNERWLPVLVEATLALIAATPVRLQGAHVVVIGKSNVFLSPFATILPRFGAKVATLETPDAIRTRVADILVTALGVPKSIGAEHVRDGAVVIDIGIAATDRGVVGDLDSDALAGNTGWYTPVPGGVGPMTVAILLEHVARAAGLTLHSPTHA